MPEHTGKNYSSHVSTGVGTTAFLDTLLAKPFGAFTFSPESASVYQFGNYGTARKEPQGTSDAGRRMRYSSGLGINGH